MPTPEQVRESLADVMDPELNIPILDLGLVYGVECEGQQQENVTVTMTLTSPMCPVGPMFKAAVESKVRSLEGVENAEVAMGLADRGYILSNGRVIASGPIDQLRADPELMQRYLAV